EQSTQMFQDLGNVAVQTDALSPLALFNEQSTQTFQDLGNVAVQTDALIPLALFNEQSTQTFQDLGNVAVQTDALSPLALFNEQSTQTFVGRNQTLSMNPGSVAGMKGRMSLHSRAKAPSVTYEYGLVTPTSICYVSGAEAIALAIYAVGQWVENVKLDIHASDYVFVGLNVDGWWQWRRQALEQLDAASYVVRAYNDGTDPLWWCGVLTSALLDLDMERNMSVSDFLVVSCGCHVGAETACTPITINEMVTVLETIPNCCLLMAKKDSVVGDRLALVLKVSVLENETPFYIVRPSDDAEKAEGTVGLDAMRMLIGEWRSSGELLIEFDSFRAVRCFSSDTNPEIRWMDVVEEHFTSVSVSLPAEASLARDTMHARLLDVTTSLWWPIRLIFRRGQEVDVF
ncbi:hypothetical protein TraAM80_06807, partial [Trypanosoma rangeli]